VQRPLIGRARARMYAGLWCDGGVV